MIKIWRKFLTKYVEFNVKKADLDNAMEGI